MYRNLYDTDVITWSPQGRIYQVEYAMEAVKQGTCAVGARSSTHVALCGIRRCTNRLAAPNRKIHKVDDNIAITFSGITADANIISQYLRDESLYFRLTYKARVPVKRLVSSFADRSQQHTQQASKRPYGVGLLIAAVDDTGPHLFETCPSGNFYEYRAQTFGSRCQGARTYLEKNYKLFEMASLRDLTIHVLRAVQESIPVDETLTTRNVHLAVLGEDQLFREIEGDELQTLLNNLPPPTIRRRPRREEQPGQDGEHSSMNVGGAQGSSTNQ